MLLGPTLSAAGTVPVILLFFLVRSQLRRHSGRQRRRAQHTLACSGHLVALVARLQQHRGMSGAWQAGDAGFARLPQKQAEAEQLFAALLDALDQEESEHFPCFSRRAVDGVFAWLEAERRKLPSALAQTGATPAFGGEAA